MGNTGIPLNGVPTNNIFEDAIDEDLSAMYPSIILSNSIDSETLIGKIVDDDDNPLYEYLGEILLESDGVFRPCVEYMGLPDEMTILENIDAFLN